MDPSQRIEEPPIIGDPPNPIDPPSGCQFRTRCPFAESVCESKAPVLGEWLHIGSHVAACHMCNPESGHGETVQAKDG
jgi:peptide/nickel transport system ATP-binding protein